MGADLFGSAADLLSVADDVLGYPVREACESGSRLADTAYVQPLMFVVNALHLRRAQQESPPPGYLAGHSLGEISALYAAGCIDFADGLDLVRRRAALMAACPPGAMLAVLGLPIERLQELMAERGFATIDVANHNLPDQVVVSGPELDISRLADVIDGLRQGRATRLNVSVAAHSRYVQPAVAEFAAVLDGISFAAPRIPVLSAVTGQEHEVNSIARRLTEQLTGRVRWWDVMVTLSRAGVDQVLEVGPGHVLSRLWERAANRLRGADAPVRAPAPRPAAVSQAAESAGTPDPGSPPTGLPATDSHRWVSALGDQRVTRAYHLRLPCLADALPCGVCGPAMLRRLAAAGLFGFLGTAGMSVAEVTTDLHDLGAEDAGGRWGIELPAERLDPARAEAITSLALAAGARYAVTAGWAGVSPQLVRWRFAPGPADGAPRRLLVRVTGSHQAESFLRPAPAELLAALTRSGQLDPAAAARARQLPVATELCVQPEQDGGTVTSLLVPVLRAAREASRDGEGHAEPIPVAAGGIGTAEEVASALLLGAGFLVTGAINQCTPQARTSDPVKDLLATVGPADTVLAPSGELFRLGGREHVVRKGTLFPARAAYLHSLHLTRTDPGRLPPIAKQTLASDCFGEPWDQITRPRPGQSAGPGFSDLLARYFALGTKAALTGQRDQQLNWHIPCGPELAAFNLAARGSDLADWRARDVVVVAERLMADGAHLLDQRLRDLLHRTGEPAALAAHS